MVSCCDTCPLAIPFMVEPGWSCQFHLVHEIESPCDKRLYLDRRARERGMTLDEMINRGVTGVE